MVDGNHKNNKMHEGRPHRALTSRPTVKWHLPTNISATLEFRKMKFFILPFSANIQYQHQTDSLFSAWVLPVDDQQISSFSAEQQEYFRINILTLFNDKVERARDGLPIDFLCWWRRMGLHCSLLLEFDGNLGSLTSVYCVLAVYRFRSSDPPSKRNARTNRK